MAYNKIKALKRQEAHNTEMNLWRASIPDALKGYNLDVLLENNWQDRLSKMGVATVKQYLESPDKFMLLHGSSGLGKTIMGVLIMDRLMEEHRVESALYIDSPTLLYELSYGDKRQENMINKMSRPDILLIDDIGAGSTRLTDIRRDGMWSIINNRWLNDKLTIITTNLPITQGKLSDDTTTIQSWFGTTSWDRIVHELCTVHFRGESMRRKRHFRNVSRDDGKVNNNVAKRK